MTVVFMSPKDRKVLGRLVEIAGSPLLVEEAFAELSRKTAEPPTLDEIVRYIIDHRDEWHARRRETLVESAVAGDEFGATVK